MQDGKIDFGIDLDELVNAPVQVGNVESSPQFADLTVSDIEGKLNSYSR